MGEYAEMAREREEEDAFLEPPVDQWRCKDGSVMQLSEMSEGHLHNTIRMLRAKNTRLFDRNIAAMEEELRLRAKRQNREGE